MLIWAYAFGSAKPPQTPDQRAIKAEISHSRHGKLGIAPLHPIGYNGGRSGGSVALRREDGKQKASARWTLASTYDLN
jgi:hypothetical protein